MCGPQHRRLPLADGGDIAAAALEVRPSVARRSVSAPTSVLERSRSGRSKAETHEGQDVFVERNEARAIDVCLSVDAMSDGLAAKEAEEHTHLLRAQMLRAHALVRAHQLAAPVAQLDGQVFVCPGEWVSELCVLRAKSPEGRSARARRGGAVDSQLPATQSSSSSSACSARKTAISSNERLTVSSICWVRRGVSLAASCTSHRGMRHTEALTVRMAWCSVASSSSGGAGDASTAASMRASEVWLSASGHACRLGVQLCARHTTRRRLTLAHHSPPPSPSSSSPPVQTAPPARHSRSARRRADAAGGSS